MAREAHPGVELGRLAASLKGEAPMLRGYVLRGPERYFRELGIRLLRRAAEERGFELSAHDVGDPDFQLARLHDDLRGGGLFASARCVIVRDPESLLKKQGREDSPVALAMMAHARATEVAGCLVLAGSSLRADHAVVKALRKAGGMLLPCRKLWDTPPPWRPGSDLRESELAQWVVERAGHLRVRLGAEQAVRLVLALGNDLAALEAQLERIRLGGPEVLEGLGLAASAKPYKVADDLCLGRLGPALAGIETLYRGGMDSKGRRETGRVALNTILLGAVRSKVRQALLGSLAVEAGADGAAAAEQAGVAQNETALRAFRETLRARPREDWEGLLRDVLELERRSKSGWRVDQNDLAHLAVKWRRTPARRPG